MKIRFAILCLLAGIMGQLQLESSTWAAQERIEQLAIEQLQFHVPASTSVVLLRPVQAAR